MKDNRVIIAGGRDFADYSRLCWFMDRWVLDNDMGPDNTDFISGEAKGADSLGKKWALSRGYKVVLFPARWDIHGRAADYKRCTEMANEATHLVVWCDQEGNGTGNIIKAATKAGLKVYIEGY